MTDRIGRLERLADLSVQRKRTIDALDAEIARTIGELRDPEIMGGKWRIASWAAIATAMKRSTQGVHRRFGKGKV